MSIDLEKAKQEFINYTENYDLTDSRIKRKKEHSIRVMEISRKIAEKKNLNQEEKNLATLIGLLHDIGRFEQQTKFKTFNDLESFDHGDYGAKLLFEDGLIRNYIEENKYDEIIRKAIKNHNKFSIEEGLTEKEEFFAELIRDADKIDIIYEATCMFWNESKEQVNNSILSKDILEQFLSEKQIKREKSRNYELADEVISIIAFIFDINFAESFEILKKENYISKILDRFDFKDTQTKESFNKVSEIATKYINSKM